jgi:hypothetical protein
MFDLKKAFDDLARECNEGRVFLFTSDELSDNRIKVTLDGHKIKMSPDVLINIKRHDHNGKLLSDKKEKVCFNAYARTLDEAHEKIAKQFDKLGISQRHPLKLAGVGYELNKQNHAPEIIHRTIYESVFDAILR